MTKNAKVSLKGPALAAQRLEKKVHDAAMTAATKDAKKLGIEPPKDLSLDSFVNFAQRMGVGADNPLTTAGYGYNPITRVRTVLEFIHRGSWLGGMAIDLVADDMTRAGVEITGPLKPDAMQKIAAAAVRLGIWPSVTAGYKWSRLYGGALVVMQIEGQDLATPLRVETIGKGQFTGLTVLDRWMVQPDLSDVIQVGPEIGLPKFYNVRADAPGLRNQRIHHTRCLRLIGIELSYWQAMTEQMWGISVLERLWDRMTAFDSASTGIAQLIYKAWIRTYKIKGFRNIVAAGGQPLRGLMAQMDMMRRMQSIEGVTLMDGDDEFEGLSSVPFTGLSDALLQLGQQVSGALGVPLVRLFGQSPAGLNSTGESDLRMYYDNINKEQNKSIVPVTTIYKVMARSEGVAIPTDFGIKFRSLWQMSDKEKAEVAETVGRAIGDAEEKGLISQQTGMKELRQSSAVTGIFTNITDEDIEAAEETLPPAGEEAANLEQQNTEAALKAKSAGAASGAEAKGGAAKSKTKDNAIESVAEMKRLHDLDVVIETEKGQVRRGKGAGGVIWEEILAADYGGCRKTTGVDGDPVDCFVGEHPESQAVWIVHQVDPASKLFDEHKVMLGFLDRPTAIATYLASYSDDARARVGWVAEMPMDEFKNWLAMHPDRAMAQ